MTAAIRAIVAGVAVAAAFWIVDGLPALEGPPMQAFAELMILPVVAALAIAPRSIRFAFLAGAIYAALAGARRLVAPEGNATAAEQLSTAAMVALLLPILAVAWQWTAARAIAALIKRLEAK